MDNGLTIMDNGLNIMDNGLIQSTSVSQAGDINKLYVPFACRRWYLGSAKAITVKNLHVTTRRNLAKAISLSLETVVRDVSMPRYKGIAHHHQCLLHKNSIH